MADTTSPVAETTDKRARWWSIAAEWAKVAVIPVVVLIGGHLLTSWAKESERIQGDIRLYAQLLIQREQADSVLRKDMFTVVIKEFLSSEQRNDLASRVLQLELLASNFNQSLDFAPLFKDTARQLPLSTTDSARRKHLMDRLDFMAAQTIERQIAVIKRRGFEHFAQFSVVAVNDEIDTETIRHVLRSGNDKVTEAAGADKPTYSASDQCIKLEVNAADVDRREVLVRLIVKDCVTSQTTTDKTFWVGLYDFPMLDNTQLPQGWRCAVAMTEFQIPDLPSATRQQVQEGSFFRLHLILFPATNSSFKERLDYDDVLTDIQGRGIRVPNQKQVQVMEQS